MFDNNTFDKNMKKNVYVKNGGMLTISSPPAVLDMRDNTDVYYWIFYEDDIKQIKFKTGEDRVDKSKYYYIPVIDHSSWSLLESSSYFSFTFNCLFYFCKVGLEYIVEEKSRGNISVINESIESEEEGVEEYTSHLVINFPKTKITEEYWKKRWWLRLTYN